MISRRGLLAVSATALAGAAPARALPALSEVLFDPRQPVLGNPEGDVTIAEFFDYACPSCRALHPHLKRIVAEDGDIRLVMKDWPINGDTVLYAARMVLAADALGDYAPALDAVMTMGPPLRLGRIDDAMRARGIDVGRVRDALDARLAGIDALLARNAAQARALGLPGTPGFVVGARLYRAALDADAIRRAVQAARAGRAG
ncbi:DsbA family protein [Aquibium sp. A9E412]|uniref:DsbA family protein n=1 Tax=Aquibium sp. A9E412 TaxID=2976767 RepID=UPI0025B06CE4|nr:DsbA family protein [Aquibium sp. A9E412]MDN2567135.1 DsbA family protein [Aquibium sp. A9E412]